MCMSQKGAKRQEIEGKKYHMSEEEIVQDVLDGKY